MPTTSSPKAKTPSPATRSRKMPHSKGVPPKRTVSKTSSPPASTKLVTTKKPLAATKPAKQVTNPISKAVKIKKPKLVRDSFAIPKAEYLMIATLKKRSASLGVNRKKSELIRAGIAVLNTLTDKAFLAALASVPTLKTGRPKSK